MTDIGRLAAMMGIRSPLTTIPMADHVIHVGVDLAYGESWTVPVGVHDLTGLTVSPPSSSCVGMRLRWGRMTSLAWAVVLPPEPKLIPMEEPVRPRLPVAGELPAVESMPPAEELEWCDLTGAVRGSDAIWRRKKARDHRYDKRVRTTETPDRPVLAWALGVGRIVSEPHYLRDDPRPYYQVVLDGESAGSYWRIDRLVELETP